MTCQPCGNQNVGMIVYIYIYTYTHTQTMEHSLFLSRFPTHSCWALLQYVITQSRSRVKLHPRNDEHFVSNLIESIIYIMYELTSRGQPREYIARIKGVDAFAGYQKSSRRRRRRFRELTTYIILSARSREHTVIILFTLLFKRYVFKYKIIARNPSTDVSDTTTATRPLYNDTLITFYYYYLIFVLLLFIIIVIVAYM